MRGVVRGAVIGADNYSTPLDNYSTPLHITKNYNQLLKSNSLTQLIN